jgi:hypothetical protein
MVMLSVLSTGIDDESSFRYLNTRGANLMWYGNPNVLDVHLDKNRAASWLEHALVRNDERYRGLVKIYDFSVPDAPQDTDHWIEINPDSVSVQPRKDEYGNWTISADFNYTVQRSPVFDAPVVTAVEYEMDT